MTSPFSPQPFDGSHGLTYKSLMDEIPVDAVVSRILFLLPLHLS